MSSTILERLRSIHEDIESYERGVVNTLHDKPRRHRDRVLQGHVVNGLLAEVANHSKQALEMYEDTDGSFKDEIELMRGNALFSTFYDRLKEIREYHKKYPNVTVNHEPNMDKFLNPDVKFTGEERFGRYLDLHEFFARFLNIQAVSNVIKIATSRSTTKRKMTDFDYAMYLNNLSDFVHVPQISKRDKDYQEYTNDLLDYLDSFYRRTQPLVDIDDVFAETNAKFQKEWANDGVKGWDTKVLKEIKQSNLYCKACAKLFSSEGVFKGHLNGKKHKNALVALKKNDVASDPTDPMVNTERDREFEMKKVALTEVKIMKLCELLTEVLDATKSYVELKQTRTHEELQAEILEDEEGVLPDVDLDADEDDEDAPVYNPLNLPLGWDGKPIPYWLYKLHGLGVEFKCEICGNHSYWGRRAFDKHFQEWRHAHGMRCLRIPNTKHFHDITLIEDAINLYDKIKDQLSIENWEAGDEEEYEDSDGNVLNKKTYEDLARQGLL